MSTEFDAFASSYDQLVNDSIAFGGQEHAFYTRRKVQALVDVATRHLGDPAALRVLDVGCGVGLTDRELTGTFGELHGVDNAADAIERAKRNNPAVQYRTSVDDRLPYDDESFDLVFAICVVHHVPTGQRTRFAQELQRVVRPGGVVAIFEHNPVNPLTRVAVSRCEFDADAVLLGRRRVASLLRDAGLRIVERRYLLFFPFERRWTRPAERGLAQLPLGAQHYAVAKR